MHQVTEDARADAVASLVIGGILLVTTVLLVGANRELLTDRAVASDVIDAMRHRLAGLDGIKGVPDLIAVFTGPHAILVTGTVELEPTLTVAEVEGTLGEAGHALASHWPGELRIYLAPVPSIDSDQKAMSTPPDQGP